MLQRSLFLILILASACLIYGQHVIFTDDFSSGLSDWNTYETMSTATPGWEITPMGMAGDGVYQTDSDPGEEMETWLVYGPFYVPNTGLSLDFYLRFQFHLYHRYAGIWISNGSGVPTLGGGDFVEVEEVDSATIYAGTYAAWSPYSVDLSGYEYETVYIAYRYWGIYADRWYVDDVEITCDDLLPTYIAGNIDLLGLADDSDVNVYIEELGHSDITDVDGDYAIETFTGTFTLIVDPDNPFYASETLTVVIAEGETTWVNLEIDITPVGFIIGHCDLTDITIGACDPGIDVYVDAPGFETITIADGSFIIESIPEGEYVVFADFAGYHTASSAPITIAAGDTIDIDTLFLDFATEVVHEEDFETSTGGFISSPVGSMWEWGAPTYVSGPPAWSGTNVWGTDLDDDYAVTLADWFLGFDMSTLGEDITEVQFYQWYDMEEEYDGGVVDISTDGGDSWERVEPVPAYDMILSAAFGNPIGGEMGFTGVSGGWVETSVDLSTFDIVTDIRFRFTSDNAYSNYPGWYLDAFSFIGQTEGPMGVVEGYVYDNVEYVPIANAMVVAGVGYVTYTDADGYFHFDEAPVGLTTITGHMSGYFPGEADVSINEYVDQIAYIPLTPVNILPEDGTEISIAYDHEDSVMLFELCNPTDHDINWWFGPWDGGLTGATLLRRSSFEDFSRPSLNPSRVPMPYNTTVSADAKPQKCDDYDTKLSRAAEMGDIVNIYDIPTVDTPWGIGLQGIWDVDYFWVSDLAGGERVRKHDFLTGDYTGFYVDVEADISALNNQAADMAWDGEYVWEIFVLDLTGFGDYASVMYAFDPETGSKADSIFDPDGPAGTSWGESGSWPDFKHSTGLAYDLIEDVFYIGGWNTSLLYKVKGQSWDVPGEVIGTPIYVAGGMAGLGFHSTRRTVWAGMNASADKIVEIDYEAAAIVNEFVCPPYSAYSMGGLEIDGEGNIWYVSMTDEKVYVLDSGFGTLPGGLYFDPPYGTLVPGECTTVYLRTSGHTAHTGRYEFDGFISVDEQIAPLAIPMVLEVCPTIDYGWNMISVPIQAVPDDPWAQLHDDIRPFDASGTGSQIYAWDPVDGRFIVPDGFDRGTGYYVWGWNRDTKIDVYGDAYTGDFPVSLTYHHGAALAGWQIIGNPYNQRIDWDKVTSDPAFYGIETTAWFFNTTGGWATYTPGMPPGGMSNEFDPWTSWWVRLNEMTAMVPFRENYTFESLAKSAEKADVEEDEMALPEFALRVSVKANNGGSEIFDKWNYLGTIAEANDGSGRDIYDHKEIDMVPPGGDLLNASFINESNRYKDEFKAPITMGTEKSWTMNVSDLESGATVTLSWPLERPTYDGDGSIGTSEFAEEYHFTVMHPITGESIDMRTVGSISFTYTAPVNIVFTVQGMMLTTDDNNRPIPEAYGISQNAPNPFNASTSFDISLIEESSVDIQIYDTRGKLVKTIADGIELPAGRFSFQWHGDTDDGSEISSGVYLYKIKTSQFEQSRKMILVK